MPPKAEKLRATPPDPTSDEAWEHIKEALRDLRFGQVVIVVQDGVLVQIERVERQRFGRP